MEALMGIKTSARLRSVVWILGVSAGVYQGTMGAAPVLTIRPSGNQGFDVLADGALVAPVRLAAHGALWADRVDATESSIHLSSLRAQDPLAVEFAPDDFVSITLPSVETTTNSARRTGMPALPDAGKNPAGLIQSLAAEPVIRFKLSVVRFNTNRWQAMFADGKAPFHFLVCSLPAAQVWHQRGWLNATPNADPFPLLQDVHVGAPEISCLWNRNWSYVCPLGAHPIPMIGVWDPSQRLYVGYDFQGARATDQSERYIATAYCWQQGDSKSFIALAYPHGGLRYGELVYPQTGETAASWFHLIIDTGLASTDDPNERFQARLFERYPGSLPCVPPMNDLGWVPGVARLDDFTGPPGLGLWGPGGESTFYPTGTQLIQSWPGHREMPIDTAARAGDTNAIARARDRLESLLRSYAKTFSVEGETCLFWEKPLAGAWRPDWGGAPVTTLHNADAWYPARVLVELYRYDRARNQVKPEYLTAIDGLFNWAKRFVWTRNEFADVPSSPFAIGGTLSAAFLLDYYFTFKNDPQRHTNAQLALHLARNVTWRYLPVWAMDSDRFDGAIDSAFLVEPNSGRDWAGLGCANEVNWNIDTLTQVYVHTGDPRMRYYLRGILQRWPLLYRPNYEDSLAGYGDDALTEGLGLFDGSGSGRGNRYNYGFTQPLPFNEPIGQSKLRVVAGAGACIAFAKNGADADVTDYRTDGNGACSFRLVSSLTSPLDISFSYPYVDISRLAVKRARNQQTQSLGSSDVIRPAQSTGDGKEAITRYLAGGGTLVLLSAGPFPFFYGDGPSDQAGPSDPLLPALGLPIQIAFEQPPSTLTVQLYSSQNILRSVPQSFPFPPGDSRLRSINRPQLNPAHRYVPILRVVNAQSRTYGDAAGYIEFRSGPAKNGKVLYVWSTLLSGPQGQAILSDVIRWILDATLPAIQINSIQMPNPNRAILSFSAMPFLVYGVEYRDMLDPMNPSGWMPLLQIPSASSQQLILLTNPVPGLGSRFYRLAVHP